MIKKKRMASMIRRAICGAMALCVAFSANAATVRFKQYTSPSDEHFRALDQIYLDGVKEGLIAFNAALASDGATPLFCLPPKLAVTVEQADDILRRAAKLTADPDLLPISVLLLEGFKDTFPCEQGARSR